METIKSVAASVGSIILAPFTPRGEAEVAEKLVLTAYLERLGYTAEEAATLIGKKPSAEGLQELLTKHQLSVPFENLGQHCHPAEKGVSEIAAKMPTLDVDKAIKKIVFEKRGGFCFEINSAFAWLLRSLGYKVRISSSNVITPGGPVPGHLCLLVDGLGPDALLVDPGFGDSPRVPLPAKFDTPVTDGSYGDRYTLVKNDGTGFGQAPAHAKRFNAILMRERKVGISGSPMVDFIGMDTPPAAEAMTPPEPVHLCNLGDNLAIDCAEFQEGLGAVLAPVEQNPFAQKRMTILMNETGFTFVGSKYVKTVAHGKEISRKELKGEKAYRDALEAAAGIKL